MSSPPKKDKTNHQNSLPTRQTYQPSTDLPHDLIFMCILPHLSYKSLSKFKCVSKTWQKVISHDAKFARDQSLHPSPISCGAVFSDCRGNKFEFLNTFGSPIGIDPHHNLLTDPKVECQWILASSCGLLCVLFKYDKSDSHSLYVGNVATGEGDVIPTITLEQRSIGLAFDPSIEPNCYKLVNTICDLNFSNLTVEYKFEVYSSKKRYWVLSTQTTGVITGYFGHRKPVSLRNIVYWQCHEYAISFDPWKDVANYIQLPMPETSDYQQELGTCNECITCTRLDVKNMVVYVFEEREKRWARKYRVDLDMLIDVNHDVLFREFYHGMKTGSGRSFGRLYQVYRVTPFPYDGGDVLFFRVQTEKLEFVLSYDSKSGKTRKFCEFGRSALYRIYGHPDERVFKYHNSMVKMPDKLPTIP